MNEYVMVQGDFTDSTKASYELVRTSSGSRVWSLWRQGDNAVLEARNVARLLRDSATAWTSRRWLLNGAGLI